MPFRSRSAVQIASRIQRYIKHTPLYPAVRPIYAKLRPRKLPVIDVAHEAQMRSFYAQFVSRGGLCFDIGANVGNRVAVFLDLGATVIAVEPQEECVETLRRRFGHHPRLTIVQGALGAAPGSAEMLISDASTISSMSQPWIDAVQTSGRFCDYQWNTSQCVEVTTLDHLIGLHGRPNFLKIDVEGYEPEVLAGLTQPVEAVSIEFTPEYLRATETCISHLRSLGPVELNYSLGETMKLAESRWMEPEEMVKRLRAFSDDHVLFGDVYIRPLAG